MKNQTSNASERLGKKVQLNTRVPEALKIAVTALSERTEIASETIVTDALARFYGAETPGASLRKRMYSEAIKQLEAEGKLILFPPTSDRPSVHGPCSAVNGPVVVLDGRNWSAEFSHGRLLHMPILQSTNPIPLAA